MVTHHCIVCGKVYVPKAGARRSYYDSPNCKAKAHREREKILKASQRKMISMELHTQLNEIRMTWNLNRANGDALGLWLQAQPEKNRRAFLDMAESLIASGFEAGINEGHKTR